ncbi:hypothetical protein Tco_1253731 [Tanacetum coccineum]
MSGLLKNWSLKLWMMFQDKPSQKKTAQATSTNILSTDRQSVSTDRPSVSTDRGICLVLIGPSGSMIGILPSVSIASTPTGTNAGESSFVYLEE